MSQIINKTQIDYLNSFRKEENNLILEMESFAESNNVPILNVQSAQFLETLVCLIKPRRVLELGTAIGYSTIRIARNLTKKGVVHSIEKSEDNFKIAQENIAKSNLNEKIKLFQGNAKDILPNLTKKYDLIFLDADKEDYKQLFDFSIILLKKNGLMFVDNLLWHGFVAVKKVPSKYKISTKYIREFNKEFLNHPNLKSTIIPVGDGIGIGIKVKNIS